MAKQAIGHVHLVYDSLTDQLIGKIGDAAFKHFVAELAVSRKDHGALDGTAYGFPDRSIYVPDAWKEVGGQRYPR